MEEPVVGMFEGFAFPVWVAVDRDAEQTSSESFATHYLTGENGEKHLPLFTTEQKAEEYIRNRALNGRAGGINDVADLLLRLEVFRNRGGNHVGIDNPDGPPDGTYCLDLAAFIDFAREQA